MYGNHNFWKITECFESDRLLHLPVLIWLNTSKFVGFFFLYITIYSITAGASREPEQNPIGKRPFGRPMMTREYVVKKVSGSFRSKLDDYDDGRVVFETGRSYSGNRINPKIIDFISVLTIILYGHCGYTYCRCIDLLT